MNRTHSAILIGIWLQFDGWIDAILLANFTPCKKKEDEKEGRIGRKI